MTKMKILSHDIAWGLRTSLGFAAGYVVIAALIFLLTRGEGFTSRGVSFQGVATVYIASSVFVGLILGLFRKYLGHAIVGTLVAIVAVFPLSTAISIMRSGSPSNWGDETWVPTVITAFVFGILGSHMIRSTGSKLLARAEGTCAHRQREEVYTNGARYYRVPFGIIAKQSAHSRRNYLQANVREGAVTQACACVLPI
jgi:hypothetical protein